MEFTLANLSGSDEKWFAPAKKAALSRQIALRLSCPTSDVVYVQKRGASKVSVTALKDVKMHRENFIETLKNEVSIEIKKREFKT